MFAQILAPKPFNEKGAPYEKSSSLMRFSSPLFLHPLNYS